MTDRQIRPDGVVTYWSLARYTRQEAFAEALKAVGFEKIAPNPRTREACLYDALKQGCSGAMTLIRPLKNRDGFQVTAERREENGNEYAAHFIVRLHPDETIDQLLFSPSPDPALAEAIDAAYRAAKAFIIASKVGHVLIDATQTLGGVCLRDTGGIYWLPTAALDRWSEVAKAAEESAAEGKTAVYLVRHAMDADSMRAIHDALALEIAGRVSRIDEEVMSGELKARALKSRQEECADLQAKIADYEAILGTALTALQTEVDRVSQAAATAVLLQAAAPEETALAA